jgi:glycerophosphoryl diester phosphodiesterase
VRTVDEAGMLDACTFISFDEDNLLTARQTNPAAHLGYFHIQPGPIDPAEVVDRIGASLLVVWPKAAEPEVVAAARAAGLRVRCGFADDMTYEESYAVFRRMAAMGVGEISCGRPDWIGRMIADVAAAQ